MANVTVDFTSPVGIIKPMHAGGQPPLRGTNFELFHYLKDVGMPYSRLHDTGGAYGQNRWVDIPNIFRDFDADVNDPASYDFTFGQEPCFCQRYARAALGVEGVGCAID